MRRASACSVILATAIACRKATFGTVRTPRRTHWTFLDYSRKRHRRARNGVLKAVALRQDYVTHGITVPPGGKAAMTDRPAQADEVAITRHLRRLGIAYPGFMFSYAPLGRKGRRWTAERQDRVGGGLIVV